MQSQLSFGEDQTSFRKTDKCKKLPLVLVIFFHWNFSFVIFLHKSVTKRIGKVNKRSVKLFNFLMESCWKWWWKQIFKGIPWTTGNLECYFESGTSSNYYKTNLLEDAFPDALRENTLNDEEPPRYESIPIKLSLNLFHWKSSQHLSQIYESSVSDMSNFAFTIFF